MNKRRLVRLVLEWVVALVMVLTSVVGTGVIQVSPRPTSQAASPGLPQPVSTARLAPVSSSPASPAGTWYAPHQPAYGPQAVTSTTPAFPQGRKPGEQPDLRTAASQTILNPDGTWTLKAYPFPIYYQDAQGNWQPIDNSVASDASDAGYAYGNKANGWHVHFARQAGGQALVHMQLPTGQIVENLDGAASVSATTKGSTILYPGVFPGTDVEYNVGSSSLEALLLLHNAGGPASYRFTYHVPGATATQDSAGNVTFTDAKGNVLFVVGGILMYEATAQGQMIAKAALSQAVAVSLSSKGSDFTITLTPDQTWLSDPRRHFPVAIDPTLGWQSGDPHTNTTDGNIYADTIDESGNPNSPYYNLNSLRIGNANVDNGLCCNGVSRAYLKFPINPPPAGVRVTSADLAIYQSSEYSGGGVQINANLISAAWNATTLTWNTHPTSLYGVSSATTAATQNTWVHFTVTSAITDWWEYGWGLDGFELQYADESQPQEFFFSDDNTNSGQRPTLTINYVQDTTAPSGTAQTGGVQFNTGVTSTNTTTVNVTPAASDAGAAVAWTSDWSGTTGIGVNSTTWQQSHWTLNANGTQLTADSSPCGSTQCFTQTYFTNYQNSNNWPTYTVQFETDTTIKLGFGIVSNDNHETRFALANTGVAGVMNLQASTSAGTYTYPGQTVSMSANTWYIAQFLFPLPNMGEIYLWPAGQVRPSAPAISFTGLYMTNPGLIFWPYGDNGANLHHVDIGTVLITTKATGSTTGYGLQLMQFSTDGTTYGCPTYSGSNTAFSGGAWCVYSPKSFSWTFPTGDGYKKLWYKYSDNAGNIGSGTSQITYDTTAPTVNYLSLGGSTASAQGNEVRGVVTLTLNATDPPASDGSASGVASAVLYVDGVPAGTPVSGTSVPTFTWDTTNLSPGEHVLTAKATDAAGNTGTIGGSTTVIVDNTAMLPFETYAKRTLPDGATDVSVNVANGDTVVTHSDLVIPGRGPELSISRTYHVLGYLNALFGWGWTSELDEGLVQDTDGSVAYYDAAGGVHIFLPDGSGGYLASPGLYLTLVQNADGSYTLTSRDQTKTTFNASGALTSVVDRNGNTLTMTHDANNDNNPQTVTDAAGRTLTITVTNGHVTQITDPASRVWLYGYDGSGNLTSYTDPSGVVTQYGYDGSHRLTSITLNYVSGGATDQQTNVTTSLTYDTTSSDSNYNRLTGLTDPLNYVVNISYSIPSTSTALQTVVAQQQGISPATYENTTYLAATDGFGAVAKLTDALNGVTTYQYDANENVTQVTDPDGHVVTSTYDSGNSNLLSRGNRLTQTVDPGSSPHLNLTTHWSYDSANNVQTTTDPAGVVTQYTYDSPTTGNLTQVIRNYVSGQPINNPAAPDVNSATSSTYDSYGEVLTTTDPMGVVTKYTYDTQGDVLTTTANYVSGGTTDSQTNVVSSATYDVLGERLTATSAPTASVPLGVVTSYGYDILGYLIQQIDNYQASQPADQQTNVTTQYGYDPLGRQVTVTNPLGYVTLSTYDKDGRGTQTTRDFVSGGATNTDTNVLWSQVIYDAAGNVLVSKDAKTLSGDPTGNITTTTYDLDNRPVHVTVTDNASTPNILQNSKTVYDAAGLTIESDTLSLDTNNTVRQAEKYTYDAAGRQATQTDPPALSGSCGMMCTSDVTTTTYDADGNVTDTTMTNAALPSPSVVTESTATFDNLNRPKSKTEQANTTSAQTSSYTYDLDGRQLTFTDPAGNVTTTSYDALGRTLTVTHPGTPTVIDYTTYDAAGERLTQCNNAGVTRDQYDALGRVINEERDTVTACSPQVVLTTTPPPYQGSVNSTYDADGNLLQQVTSYPNGPNSTYNWTYDKLDRPVTMTDGTRAYTYDINGNITQETVGNFIETDISYDGKNRSSTFTDKVGSIGTTLHSYGYTYNELGNRSRITTDGVATTYTYDGLSELMQAQGSTTTTYTYDANGNRKTMVTSAGTTNYSYDSSDVELTSKTDSTGKVTNYTYDTNGNLTTAVYDPSGANQTTIYTYDANNRLMGVTEPNGTSVTFSYDADGNRISKAVSSGGTTTTIKDVYALGHLTYQTDGSGSIIASYTYDTNGLPTSVVLGSPTAGPRYFYVYNGHGDVVALTDHTGAVVASYSYDAFGVTTSTETIPNVPTGWSNPYRFDGAEGVQYDPETGFYWMSVRAYDPTLGRFISHDPLGRSAAMGLNNHPYVYVGNNPLNQTDPSGLFTCSHPAPDGWCTRPGQPPVCVAPGGCDSPPPTRQPPPTPTPTPTPPPSSPPSPPGGSTGSGSGGGSGNPGSGPTSNPVFFKSPGGGKRTVQTWWCFGVVVIGDPIGSPNFTVTFDSGCLYKAQQFIDIEVEKTLIPTDRSFWLPVRDLGGSCPPFDDPCFTMHAPLMPGLWLVRGDFVSTFRLRITYTSCSILGCDVAKVMSAPFKLTPDFPVVFGGG